MIKVRYAYHPITGDQYPIIFRADCERTFFDPITGNDESLLDVINRLRSQGWQLIDRKVAP